MDGYESGDDLFLMQNSFHIEEEITTQKAVETADALDQFLDYDQWTSGIIRPKQPVWQYFKGHWWDGAWFNRLSWGIVLQICREVDVAFHVYVSNLVNFYVL